MIEYHIRRELNNLIVCLYDPSTPEPFTLESLGNYVDDCSWQLESGEKPRRIPFHITPSRADALRHIESMNRTVQAIKKERLQPRL